jgi:hypothetical protein
MDIISYENSWRALYVEKIYGYVKVELKPYKFGLGWSTLFRIIYNYNIETSSLDVKCYHTTDGEHGFATGNLLEWQFHELRSITGHSVLEIECYH